MIVLVKYLLTVGILTMLVPLGVYVIVRVASAAYLRSLSEYRSRKNRRTDHGLWF